MKSFAVLLLLGVFAHAQGVVIYEWDNVLSKCKAQTKATEDIGAVLDKGNLPQSPEGKCAMACLLDAAGLMKGGMLDKVSVEQSVRQDNAQLPALDAEVAAFLKECVDPALAMEKCEAAVSFWKCGQFSMADVRNLKINPSLKKM